MADTIETYSGIDLVGFARKLADAQTSQGVLIPWQTKLTFDPQRDANSTSTKDGVLTSISSLSTDIEIDFNNNSSAIADAMYDSLIDGDVLELWVVNRKRKNADGKYFAWYLQARVTEDSNDNDADDISERDVTFTPLGSPKRGWTILPDAAQEAIDYIYRGLDKVTPASGEIPEANGGVAWDSDTGSGTTGA